MNLETNFIYKDCFLQIKCPSGGPVDKFCSTRGSVFHFGRIILERLLDRSGSGTVEDLLIGLFPVLNIAFVLVLSVAAFDVCGREPGGD